ncbi:MAG: alpha/beta fold hydrolase [Thermoanaerobacteraceae bacterium]|nr:alpha/beta fold hydrolase [Thermoanaerobacteraceae bacterium]
MKKLPAQAKPFYFNDRKAVCLLIHGFASTPSEVRWLGEQLYGRGYAVRGVLLTGHGTTPEEFAQTGWPQWYRSVEQAFLELKERHDRILTVGVSMGGLLALMLAADYPQAVSGVVTAGTPGARRFFRDWRIHLTPLIKHFIPYHIRQIPEDKKRLHRQMGRVYYVKRPLSAVHSLLKLTDVVKKRLPQVYAPVLVMHSRADATIHPGSARFIYSRLGTQNKKLFYVERSDHIITLDKERDLVLNCIDGFFREIMGYQGY